MPRKLILIMALVAVVLTATSVYAFTAANTVPTSKAGVGSAVISGYTVSAVHYNLNSTDPAKIDSTTFTLDTAPAVGSTTRVRLDSTGTTWYNCTFVGANVTCVTTTPAATVAAADQLEIVVAQ